MVKSKTGKFSFSDAGKADQPSDGSVSDAIGKVLDLAGSYGKWQYCMFMCSFCGVFAAMNNLAAAFLAVTPPHWCRIPGLEGTEYADMDLRNYTIPLEKNNKGEVAYSGCKYYVRNYSQILATDPSQLFEVPPPSTPNTTCSSWHYDNSIYTSTIVNEWDLVCGNRWLMSSAQATYMAGVLVGAVVFSELSDKYGRRTIVLVSTILMIVTSIATAFTYHYLSFIILRFFVAAAGSGLFLPNFVLLMEVIGPRLRTVMGMMYQAFFSVGFCLLPAIAYVVRDWRNLQLCISVPSATLLLYFWLLPESPRWLMMKGRYDEALVILRRVAKVNGRQLPPQEELDSMIASIACHKKAEEDSTGILSKIFKFFQSQITLLSTRNMRRRCLIIFFSWFVVSMVYYGLTFSGGNIDASIYLMVFISGIVEIPSYVLVIFTMTVFGRRWNLIVLFIICGAACLGILAVPKGLVWINLVLASIGKFFNSAAFAVAYIYSAELVPTSVRNIAVGTSSMCARIGSIIAPYIVDLLGDLHYAVPSTVFGVLSLLAGVLALLLPETSKRRLPETVEEVESMKK